MIRPLIVVVIVILLVLLARWIAKQPKGTRWQIIAIATATVLVGLAVTGRIHWLMAAIGAALPFVRRLIGLAGYWPLLNQLRGKGKPSSFSTAYLHVQVDLARRRMSGEVVRGQFSGHSLDSLSTEQLNALRSELKQSDAESYALLLAYLQFRSPGTGQSDDSSSAQYKAGTLSVQEAYAILGLKPGASKDEIIAAHRRLIQKLHPDRGGSSYLATKINLAKETLLNR